MLPMIPLLAGISTLIKENVLTLARIRHTKETLNGDFSHLRMLICSYFTEKKRAYDYFYDQCLHGHDKIPIHILFILLEK